MNQHDLNGHVSHFEKHLRHLALGQWHGNIQRPEVYQVVDVAMARTVQSFWGLHVRPEDDREGVPWKTVYTFDGPRTVRKPYKPDLVAHGLKPPEWP